MISGNVWLRRGSHRNDILPHLLCDREHTLAPPGRGTLGVWEETEDGVALYLLDGEYEEALCGIFADGLLRLKYGDMELCFAKAEKNPT